MYSEKGSNERKWKKFKFDIGIVLYLAFIVCCLYVALIKISGWSIASSFDHGIEGRVNGLAGCIMLFLLYLSWKYYKDDEKPIMKSVLLGAAAGWISFFNQSPLYALLWLLPHLFLTVLLSFTVKKIIWLFAAGTNPTQRKQKRIRGKTWLICLGIVFIYYLFFIAEANSWPEPSTFPGNWNQILLICLPFIDTFIFKRIKERLQLENTYALFKISICYFGSCVVLYLVSLGLVHIISNPIAYRSLGIVSYYNLMGIIVYAVEIRAMGKEKGAFARWPGRAASFLVIVVYIVVCNRVNPDYCEHSLAFCYSFCQ